MKCLRDGFLVIALRATVSTACSIPLIAGTAVSQVQPFRINGSLHLSSQYYNAVGIEARRSRNISRAILQTTILVYDQIQLPFELYISTQDQGYRQPFNQFGASPRLFGWLTLHGGYFTSRLSDFTFGDTRLLGGGIEIHPSNFRLSVLYGRSQQAIEPDTLAGFRGAYERTMMGAKLGFGSELGFHFDFNIFRAIDDSNSISGSGLQVAPQENLVGSMSFGFSLFEGGIRLGAEVGGSAFTNDLRSEEIETVRGKFGSLFVARTSSQLDGAARVSVVIVPSRSFSLGLNGRWVGPGYVTLGYAQLPNDVVEISASPSGRFFEGQLALRASLGIRNNNLRHNRSATTRRTIGMVSASIQTDPRLGFDVQYQNYGMKATPSNDTLRIDNISQSFSFSPRYSFPAFGGNAILTMTASLQEFTDRNEITSASTANQNRSLLIGMSNGFTSSLALSTIYMYRSTKTSVMGTEMHSIIETVSKRFFDEKLSASVSAGFNRIIASSSDGQFTGRINLSYRLNQFGTLSANFMTNSYNYGDDSPSVSFSDYQGNLQYSISF